MILPTIHLNGTSKEQLLAPWHTTVHLLQKAQKSLQEAAPNGRDYYPQGAEAMRQAEAEHLTRMMRLEQLIKELDDMRWAIADIGD